MTLVVFALFEPKKMRQNLLKPLLHHLTFLSGFAATTTDRTTRPRPRTPWRRQELSRTPSPPAALTRYSLDTKSYGFVWLNCVSESGCTHCKKVIVFPVPSRHVTNQILPGQGARESLAWVGGTGKTITFFTVVYKKANHRRETLGILCLVMCI
jgi:hypothetical protein